MVDGRVNIIVKLEQPDSKETEASKKPTLLDKVEYAIDCLTADVNTKKAGSFLVDVYEKLCECSTVKGEREKIMRMIIPQLELFYPHKLRSTHYLQYKKTREPKEFGARSEDLYEYDKE